MPAITIGAFIGGAGMVVMGIMAMANKDHNPQGAQGAWKKVAAGAALMVLSVVTGVLSNTITGAQNG
jgi:hypothetical protein